MTKTLNAFLVLLAIGCFASTPSLAQNGEADLSSAGAIVQALADDTIAVLEDETGGRANQDTQFRALMERGFNVDFMARLVLGRHWNSATETQREAYLGLFDDFMLYTITSRLAEFTGQKFVVTGTAPAGKKDVVVNSEVVDGTERYIVQWRVRDFDGATKVIDVKAEGVSMVITNREEFSSIVQQRGMDGLLSTLTTKIAELKAEAEGKKAPAPETPASS